MYFVYVLQSELDHTRHVGYTSDVERRIYEHNHGKSTYTRRKRPWKIIYVEE